MSTRKIEALVDGIANFHRWHEPESDAYQLKNPLLIKSFARPGKHVIDPEGRRVFPSKLDGYKAALFDMDLKVHGNSRAGLRPDDLLINLLRVYGLSEPAGQEMVVTFLRKVFKDVTINKQTPLSYFQNEVIE